MKIQNTTKATILCEQARTADTFFRRAAGLMFRKEWNGFDGLVLSPCNSIHTFWMRMPIDVCFLDREQRVVRTFEALDPWKLAMGGRGSETTLEFPVGTLNRSGTEPGDLIEMR